MFRHIQHVLSKTGPLNYPDHVSVKLAILLDSAALIISAGFSVFLRGALPLGEPYTVTSSVQVLTWIIVLSIGLVGSFLINRTRSPLAVQVLLLMLLSLAVTATAYIFSSHESISRLLLVYFGFLFFIFLILARLLTNLVSTNKDLMASAQRLGRAISQTLAYAKARPHLLYLEVLLAAAFGIAWSNYIISMGLGFTPDSTTYLTTALKLAYMGQLSQPPLWPPLYPILIAAITIFARFPADTAAIASSICLSGFLILFALLLRKVNKNVMINLLVISVLATLKGFYRIFETAYSEQLFALILIGCFYALQKFLETRRYGFFLLGTVLAGLAMVTRYVGMSLGMVVLLLSIFWLEPRMPLGQRITKFLGTAVLAFIPLAAWVLRNYSIYGSLFGSNRIHQEFSIAKPLSAIYAVAIKDLGIPFLAILAGILLLHFVASARFGSGRQTQAKKLVFLFMAIYLIFLTLSASISTVDIDSRSLAPVYFLPLLFLAAQVHDLTDPKKYPGIAAAFLKISTIGILAILAFMFINQSFSFKNEFVDRRQEASGLALEQIDKGFNLSTTSRELNVYFHQGLLDQDRLVLFIFFDDKNHYASSFMFKGSLIRNPDFHKYRYANATGSDYEIHFSSAAGEKAISYFDTTAFSKGLLFPEELLAKATLSGTGRFYILVNEKWFVDYDLNPLNLVGPPEVTLLSSSHIEPYWIIEAEIN